MTQEQAVARYGGIDLASMTWGRQNLWMKLLPIPPVFPNWKVMQTALPVTHIYCNVELEKPLTTALADINARGLNDALHTFDGCFFIRLIRGSNSELSAHSWGCAIDINAAENPLGSTSGGLYDQTALVDCFIRAGLIWGANFSRPDAQHFSWLGF